MRNLLSRSRCSPRHVRPHRAERRKRRARRGRTDDMYLGGTRAAAAVSGLDQFVFGRAQLRGVRLWTPGLRRFSPSIKPGPVSRALFSSLTRSRSLTPVLRCLLCLGGSSSCCVGLQDVCGWWATAIGVPCSRHGPVLAVQIGPCHSQN
ncbi:hypothetical protein BV20DRAFT_356527 [Pilatotrama ljubarskyi]|nr:hypothetical protein BV20DRAFT_356527 [Pilatotrama ljubarskyi]